MAGMTDTLVRAPGRPVDRRGWAWAAVGAVLLLLPGWLRWRRLRAGASDLGIFDQAVWLMAHGRAPFVTTIGIDVFADHVSPVLALFVPLYRLTATPLWLLAAQAVCLGLTVVPMRRLADELGASRGWATAATLGSATLLSAAVYDVHPVVLATPAVAWALLAARRDDVRTATWAGVAVAICRADAVTALLGIALLAGPAVRRRLLWLVPVPLILSFVVPHLLGTWQTFDRYYGRLGTSPADALLHPWRLALVLPTAALQYGAWLLPVGFLPLRRPRWAAAVAVAGMPLLLSSWPGVIEPWWHHAAFLVPLVVGGALAAVASTSATSRPPSGSVTRRPPFGVDRVRLGCGLVVALALVSPWSPFAPDEVRLPAAVAPADPRVRAEVAAVGPGESVSAPNTAAGELAQRPDVFIWPCPFRHPPGPRRCTHPQLFPLASHVDVVVLPGRRDLSRLDGGRWQVMYRNGITVARRLPAG